METGESDAQGRMGSAKDGTVGVTGYTMFTAYRWPRAESMCCRTALAVRGRFYKVIFIFFWSAPQLNTGWAWILSLEVWLKEDRPSLFPGRELHRELHVEEQHQRRRTTHSNSGRLGPACGQPSTTYADHSTRSRLACRWNYSHRHVVRPLRHLERLDEELTDRSLCRPGNDRVLHG